MQKLVRSTSTVYRRSFYLVAALLAVALHTVGWCHQVGFANLADRFAAAFDVAAGGWLMRACSHVGRGFGVDRSVLYVRYTCSFSGSVRCMYGGVPGAVSIRKYDSPIEWTELCGEAGVIACATGGQHRPRGSISTSGRRRARPTFGSVCCLLTGPEGLDAGFTAWRHPWTIAVEPEAPKGFRKRSLRSRTANSKQQTAS